jgi:TPP-dependent pyruvate/acetoin dehydrogenase alpha subunit
MATSRIPTDYDDFRNMLLIRKTEELILELFAKGELSGTTHTCVGQEADAVGVIGRLDPSKDHVVSNHRCHGHYLAFGGPLEGLLGEIMGRANGVCGGRGGSQHLKWKNFYANGILGGGIPMGCGIALGEKRAGSDGITVICLGDGAMGEGLVYECLNMAALWNLPVFFLVENNRYAQSTPVELGVAGNILDRAAPFGIMAAEIETTDVRHLRTWGQEAVDFVRANGKPFWGVIHTYRLAAHSKGDDFRSKTEIEQRRRKDPLNIQAQRLSPAEKEQAAEWVGKKLNRALQAAEKALPASIRENELRHDFQPGAFWGIG